MPRLRLLVPVLLLVSTIAAARPAAVVHHDLAVTLEPGRGRLEAEDRITLPEGLPVPAEGLVIHLHRGLAPVARTEGVRLERAAAPAGASRAESFRVLLPPETRSFVLSYAGEIRHALESEAAEYARGFRETPGLISGEGVYLSESSLWYPLVGDALVTFRLEVRLPEGWESVSQGTRTLHELAAGERRTRWESPEPQTEIHLVAAAFTEYTRREGGVEAMAFLRTPDRALAERYLAATGEYLSLYARLLGPYPYRKFALVENFWETGYGMPSFTLLGPKILRFPFILTSSYPHEILHNWWGNGVYAAPESGNWTEGLTAYLSDHLFQEQKGEGAAYREVSLQKYTDYVSSRKDFPLSRFLGRHSSATEAVGYGKALLFFHMLRLELGDEAFVRGLRAFYEGEKFRRAGFDDLRRAFEAVSGRDLSRLFRQWVERPGAPRLKLRDVAATPSAGGYRLRGLLEQAQPGEAYLLRVPLAVTVEGSAEAVQSVVSMEGKRLRLELSLPARPLRVDVDPEFDVFRSLDPKEIPPALSGLLGAEKVLALLPAGAPPAVLAGYREVARTVLGAQGSAVEVRLDSEVSRLPRGGAVWVLGWENRWLPEVGRALGPYDAALDGDGLRVGQESFPRSGRSAALATRPRDGDGAVGFLAADDPRAVPGLGRKLPHYHKWSWLVFEGLEPTNAAKGRWPVTDSPLAVSLTRGAPPAAGRLPPRRALATLPPETRQTLPETIRFLAADELEGRGFGSQGLDRAAEFIADRFRAAGLRPGGENGGYFQSWRERGGDPEGEALLRNVIGLVPGSDPPASAGSVVLGAHYDHLGRGWPDARAEDRGRIHPGADDNASGVAALLQAAAAVAAKDAPRRTIAFVAFAGEEAGRRGSKRYVAEMGSLPGGRAEAMVNLDTVGRLHGRELLVLGAGSAEGWPRLAGDAAVSAGVRLRVVAGDPGGSDQASFLRAGIPAIQLFSGPHADYHRPTDTPEKIDAEGLARVTQVAQRLVEALASGPTVLRPATGAAAGPLSGGERHDSGRRVSLGTVPDFAYEGSGVRLSAVSPGSPAEAAGLRGGDVIVGLGSAKVEDLASFSGALKGLSPGERVSIRFLRGGVEGRTEVRLEAR